jgi:hypothetical protein
MFFWICTIALIALFCSPNIQGLHGWTSSGADVFYVLLCNKVSTTVLSDSLPRYKEVTKCLQQC